MVASPDRDVNGQLPDCIARIHIASVVDSSLVEAENLLIISI